MHARALEEARALDARAQFERQQVMVRARGQLDGLAQASLLWSLGALVVCCVPGPQIMALVRYAAARAAARKLDVAVPGKATAGLAIAVLSIAVGVTFVTWAIIHSEDLKAKAEARVIEIDKQLAARPPSAPLDAVTACAVAERHVLTDGYDGKDGHLFGRFECAGKLTVANDLAELADVSFQQDSNSKKKNRVNACLAHGSKWYVSALSEGRCPLSTPVVSASATPPTVGSAALVPPAPSGRAVTKPVTTRPAGSAPSR